MRYVVVDNTRPERVICATGDFDEACYAVVQHALHRLVDCRGQSVRDAPSPLLPALGEREASWPSGRYPRSRNLAPRLATIAWRVGYGDREAWRWVVRFGEDLRYVPRPGLVLLEDGHVILPSNERLAEGFRRVWDRRSFSATRVRDRGGRPAAYRIDDHRFHSTMVLDDPVEEDVPRVRPGARVPDNWDLDGCFRISKCWKDQSRRRHQYRPVMMD